MKQNSKISKTDEHDKDWKEYRSDPALYQYKEISVQVSSIQFWEASPLVTSIVDVHCCGLIKSTTERIMCHGNL